MKIAVVGPSPVPFTIGGAENLMWGLCDSINKYTEHQAELIKIPTKELSFWELIDSYYNFYMLDLSHFDLVISSKYPSWMVRHPNCICYMMHTLRGLYDTYHLMNQPIEVERGCKPIDDLLDYMECPINTYNLDYFFKKVFDLRNNTNVPTSYFAFPGPLIRRLVHYMDSCALKQPGMKKYCAISDTVKNRKDYFPKGTSVQTIYPPSTLKNAITGDYKYVFMISRLDGPKRIDMLIKAMKYVKSNVQLLIAGTGPERERLEKLAEGDTRIKFLGFVRDEEVENYYANCLVVPYFPYDEDYGYITLEAMLYKKPVITTTDAGGPTEFVKDGENGFIVSFNEKRIAEKIDFFANHPEKAREFGENGYELVKKINWKSLTKELLEVKGQMSVTNENRKKIVVTSTFTIYPPQGGGQARTYSLYKNLAKNYDVEIISFDTYDKRKESMNIASGLIETKIPKSEMHQAQETKIESKLKIPVTDIAMMSLAALTPEYGKEIERAVGNANLFILSHPYLYPQVSKYLGNKPFVYEAQDVEYVIKKEMLPDNPTSQKLLEQLYEVEKTCCEKSALIMTCSEEDKETLAEIYQLNREKIIVAPNGVDCSETPFISIEERLKNKKQLGLENEKIGLFMGSWHQPNLDACERVFEIAKKCPNVKFFLMGSQCLYFQNRDIPTNVGLLGVVNEMEKNRVFSTVDFALNPMYSGSGTNLKMFDYMSAGIPIITSEFGTRGIDNKNIFIIADTDEMAEIVDKMSIENEITRVIEARKYVEEEYDWRGIVEKMRGKIEESMTIKS